MIDSTDINNYINKNPYIAKEPADMRGYSNMHNMAKLTSMNQAFPDTGVHKFLNKAEEDRSKPVWPPFSYVINEHGYRDVFPSTDTKNLLGFFGCSITFGEGMDTLDNFPHIVSTTMNRDYINLGQPGAGAMRIALMFDAATNIWDIDTAIITLPNSDRFLYMDRKGLMSNIILPHPHAEGSENEEVRKCLVHEFSDQYFQYMFLVAVNYIINVAKRKNIKLILGGWEYRGIQMLAEVFNYRSPFLENDYNVMTARDNAHPHPKSCKIYADKLVDYLQNNKFIGSYNIK